MAKYDFDDLMSVGVDIGKDVFHLVGFDHDGQRVLRKKIKRLALIDVVARTQVVLVIGCSTSGLDT